MSLYVPFRLLLRCNALLAALPRRARDPLRAELLWLLCCVDEVFSMCACVCVQGARLLPAALLVELMVARADRVCGLQSSLPTVARPSR